MKNLYEQIRDKEASLAVIGLGYVGLPLAIAFAEKVHVIGFDINKEKVEKLRAGIDPTGEIGSERLQSSAIRLTSDETDLKAAAFFIVAVPTPVTENKTPELNPVIQASRSVGRNLSRGSVVVYESTVYPGVTEEICAPLLEEESGLKCGTDFKIGYSPERINPGDTLHTVDRILKVVSAQDEETLQTVAHVYSLIVQAGVYKAESIKVAEAAKVIENTQRDINIAFVNELSMIFSRMNIDTQAVLKAAGTKWNFLNFAPGLVGGHCIGVDPYYLTYKAEALGYHPQIILSGRRINDDMGRFVAENTVKQLIKTGKHIKDSKVLVLGITFKENVPDIRNSKVIDIVSELKEYGLDVAVCDEVASRAEVREHYGIDMVDLNEIEDADAIIVAVAHHAYRQLELKALKHHYKKGKKVLIDVKALFDRKEALNLGYLYWRL